jgi:hypothetical protein
MTAELWTYREDVVVPAELEGFEVEARDGKVGKVHQATNEVRRSFLVVDTGPWIFGRKVMVPASPDPPDRPGYARDPLGSHEGADQELAGVRPGHLPPARVPGARREVLRQHGRERAVEPLIDSPQASRSPRAKESGAPSRRGLARLPGGKRPYVSSRRNCV